MVRVVDDHKNYPYCIGKTGTVIEVNIIVILVEFDFLLPIDPANTKGEHIRQFIEEELEIDKEAKVLTILRQWKDSK